MGITSVCLNDELEKPLEVLSVKLNRTKSDLINQAISEFIARQSLDDMRWEETLLAIQSSSKGELIDETEVNAWLNSWGTEHTINAPAK